LLKITLLALLIFVPLISSEAVSANERETKQAKLDLACEQARQIALAPRKLEVYEECINKFKKDEEYCLKQGDEYNGNRINAGPLFYDLPECEAAFKYHADYRNSH